VGRVLVHLRKERGLTQVQVVAATGISPATYSRLESGHIPATIEQLGALAVAFGTTPSRILQLADDAVRSMKGQGIDVNPRRLADPQESLKEGLMAIGGLALGVLVVAGIAAAVEESRKASRTKSR
jgi:transcriptional regulator with XRE-family HTH domain